MAHFAKIENGVVREVIVIGNGDCLDENGDESEAVGQAFIAACGIAGEWKQTSYNNNFRGKYAAIGDTYDAVNDVFVAPAVEPTE
jgi:hypothetical protein